MNTNTIGKVSLKTIEYVSLSDLFEGLTHLKEVFDNAEYPWTWGDTMTNMIWSVELLNYMRDWVEEYEECEYIEEEDYDENIDYEEYEEKLKNEFEMFENRMKEIKENSEFAVDLMS